MTGTFLPGLFQVKPNILDAGNTINAVSLKSSRLWPILSPFLVTICKIHFTFLWESFATKILLPCNCFDWPCVWRRSQSLAVERGLRLHTR